jgi:phosphoribosylformylglycinamidine synthase I
MKIAVVQFPGSNCERETRLAIERIGLEPMDCFWYATAEEVESFDGFIIVGGFSYEDRVRSGLIASQDPFMHLLKKEAAKGKPILGICNGAQILVESGLMGGPIALTDNQRIQEGKLLGTGFYNDWVRIKSNQIGESLPISLPIAHAEGRFLIDENFYQFLEKAGATFYTYCGENPNGSQHDLAGISNAAGNVMAMMPHPERSKDADIILERFFKKTYSPPPPHLIFSEKAPLRFHPYQATPNAQNYWVALKIDDNAAISLENTLKAMGHPRRLKRLIHWELSNLDEKDRLKLLKSEELFNPQKEYLTEPKGDFCYLIQSKDDPLAFEKETRLRQQFHEKKIGVKRGVLWCSDQALPPEAQGLLGNPLSQEGFIL